MGASVSKRRHAAEFKPTLQQRLRTVCRTLCFPAQTFKFRYSTNRSKPFFSPPPYVGCAFVRRGQWGHSCWRGANVMRMFTRLQVTVPLTLPGRSATFAQSLHLTPNTLINTWTCSLAFSFLSLSSVTCSFIRNEGFGSRCWCEGRLHPHLYFTINQTVGLWEWIGGDSPRRKMLKLSQDERMLMCRSWGTVCLCACMLGEGA